jgi:hypothetical protein
MARPDVEGLAFSGLAHTSARTQATDAGRSGVLLNKKGVPFVQRSYPRLDGFRLDGYLR